MMKFLEVVGVAGGILVIVLLVLVIGAVVLWTKMTSNGQNPFQ
jgi:uncharacterized protein YxeA